MYAWNYKYSITYKFTQNLWTKDTPSHPNGIKHCFTFFLEILQCLWKEICEMKMIKSTLKWLGTVLTKSNSSLEWTFWWGLWLFLIFVMFCMVSEAPLLAHNIRSYVWYSKWTQFYNSWWFYNNIFHTNRDICMNMYFKCLVNK